MQIGTVGVVGAGLMGSGIAQVAALAGYRTILRDLSDELLQKARAGIVKRIGRLVEKEEITQAEAEAAIGRISTTTDLADFRDADLVIEAIVEDLSAKNELWTQLEDICPPATLFASNTSSLTITDMASSLRDPGRMVGLHFFNPVPVMKLVEVVRTLATTDSTFETAREFVSSLGKTAIECRDNSGFIVNLLLVPYMMDAIRALERGVGTVEDIDQGMRLGTGHPMGPFTLCDFVGIDTLGRIGEIMFDEYREQRYAPPPLLRRMISLGYLGRKSGRGFYDYTVDPPVPIGI